MKISLHYVGVWCDKSGGAKIASLLQSSRRDAAAPKGPFGRRPLQQLGQNTRAIAG